MSQISVIVPVYNVEKTLLRCLNSISKQTYEDFEVLLINDGSTDKSAELCAEFCSKDSRFKLINQENAGPSAARNKGIDNAVSKYLAFVDSDDYIEPDMLEEFYNAAEKSNADITICSLCEENENGQQTVYKYLECYKPGVYANEKCRQIAVDSIDIDKSGNIPPYSCVRFVRRECMENPKMRFNTKVYRSEDYLLWTQMFFRINTLCLITDKVLYHYVTNPTSITHSYIENYWDMAKLIFSELKETLPKEKVIDEHLNFLLLYRARLALSLAAYGAKNKERYIKELKMILNDVKLKKAVDSIPVIAGIKKQKFRYILLRFRLYPIIKLIYNRKYRRTHTS